MSMARTSWRTITVALVATLAAAVASPGRGNAAPDGTAAPLHVSAGDVVKGSYIVIYRTDAGSAAKGTAESRVRAGGGRLTQRYTAGVAGFAATLSDAALDTVRHDPSVAYVETDSLIHLDTGAAPSWGIDRINQRRLPLDGLYWANDNGAGVNVYVVDTGVRATHVEFGGRATLDANFVGDGRSDDCIGHGTHVAGTVGGATVGVAPRTRIHAVRVFGCAGTSPTSTIMAGVNWVTANAQRPAVINMSIGGGIDAALDASVTAAINAGITTVVAAGNDADDACNHSPSHVAAAVTVANSTAADARSASSNFGSCVDLFAPGTAIISAWNTGDTAAASLTGTSMASPHVAGTAALYLQRHPGATPQQVRDFIVGRATPGVITDAQAAPNLLLYSTFDAAADYNGDGVTDVAVWRPSDGNWFARGLFTTQWGAPGDIPVPGDYNGDGITDLAVWRPSSGTWFVRGIATVQWGAPGDIPVPGDYNGDGITDFAVWRPSSGTWFVRGLFTVQWGVAGDVPVAGDYNGDGRTDVAVWRPAEGNWYVLGISTTQWGVVGDVPVPADFNGDGVTDIVVWRPSSGTWFVRGLFTVQWGVGGDIPVAGDFTGDGLTEITVWRPSEGNWYVRLVTTVQWGVPGDVPVA
ncbi:MAG: hypothetical protein QOE03_1154 [Micromonosporaceae bacterium]|jgi:subtilisin family serine protease|nr:hypothetical protein [Micromonosporaceae bacterium]